MLLFLYSPIILTELIVPSSGHEIQTHMHSKEAPYC